MDLQNEILNKIQELNISIKKLRETGSDFALKEKCDALDKAIEYIDIETQGCDKEPIEGSWLYHLYAIRDILGDKENK